MPYQRRWTPHKRRRDNALRLRITETNIAVQYCSKWLQRHACLLALNHPQHLSPSIESSLSQATSKLVAHITSGLPPMSRDPALFVRGNSLPADNATPSGGQRALSQCTYSMNASIDEDVTMVRYSPFLLSERVVHPDSLGY